MRLKISLVVVVASLGVAGCGSNTKSPRKSPEQQRVADLARKCGESEAVVADNVKVFLTAASDLGVHSSISEATDALDTVVDYAERQKVAPDCKRLLSVLVTVGRHPPKGRVCFPYETGRICVVPPLKG